MTDPLKRPGEVLTWASNGKAKRGVVRAIVRAGEDAGEVMAKLGIDAELKSQVRVARADRYLVEAQRASQRAAVYTPTVSVIDKMLRATARGDGVAAR